MVGLLKYQKQEGVLPVTLEQRVQDIYGMQPDAKRLTLLPYAKGAGTSGPMDWTDWTAPQWVYDGVKAFSTPGHVAQGGVVTPNETTDIGLALMGFGGPAPAGSLGMNAWHGGPHKWAAEPGFPHGRPRLDKMGTGEGAQAYGHGFYSAESKGVAGDYQNKLSEAVFMTPDGEIFDPSVLRHMNVRAGIRKHDGDVDALLKEHSTRGIPGKTAPPETVAAYQRDIAALKDIQKRGGLQKGSGHLYKLDIPDEDIAKYLDWDKPLSEQPDIIEKLKKAGFEYAVDDRGGFFPDLGSTDTTTGRMLYKSLGVEGEASEVLRKAGIPGLKYFDGMSRGKGEGSRNYVTWDQDVLDRIKILERNNELLKAGGT